MEDLLKPVRTVRNVKSNIEKFETLSLGEKNTKNELASARNDILVSEVTNGTKKLSTRSRVSQEAKQGSSEIERTANVIANEDSKGVKDDEKNLRSVGGPAATISSPEQALAMLGGQTSVEEFESVVRYLDDGVRKKNGFNLHVPSAVAAQILNVLVARAIPDRWWTLSSTTATTTDKSIRRQLLSCMSSPAGLGALVARIQALSTSPQLKAPGSSEPAIFKDLVSFFNIMVYRRTFVRDLLSQVQSSPAKAGQQQALWTEATSLLGGSKILNAFLEASTRPELQENIPVWLKDARDYSRWLGGNIALAAINLAVSNADAWKMLAGFLKRSLSLGHKGGQCSILIQSAGG